MQIQLFITCLIDSLFPEVGEAILSILGRLDIGYSIPKNQTCCGQPAFNAGYWEDAKKMALHTLDIFYPTQGYIIIPSGSCGDMVKHHYSDLFHDDQYNLKRAQQVSERTFEFSQFLVDVLKITDLGIEVKDKIAYHPSCHLLRGMKVDKQPKALLSSTNANVYYLEPECCGFGGVFSVDYAELSTEMLTRKIKDIQSSGAKTVVACDVSCLMHISGGLRREGIPIRCMHLAELLVQR